MNLFNRKKSSNNIALKIIGGAALAAIAAGLITNFADIKRYIKMMNM